MVRSLVLLVVASLQLLAGCMQPRDAEVTVIDLRNRAGAYVLVYSGDAAVRTLFENRLVADLAARDIKGFPSHRDLPDVRATSRDSVLAAANAHKALFVLVVEEIPPGQVGAVRNPKRITHEHPTLRDFYEHTRPPGQEYDAAAQVFVEVNAFLIQEQAARLVWSGTTWSFQADGQGGRIEGVSATIAEAIDRARRQYLNQRR